MVTRGQWEVAQLKQASVETVRYDLRYLWIQNAEIVGLSIDCAGEEIVDHPMYRSRKSYGQALGLIR